MKHIRRLFRWTEGLRVRRAERQQSRLEPFPHLSIGVGLVQVHFRQHGDPLEIGQGRHVHNRKTRQLRLGDFDHQNPDCMVGVLRFLHGKTNQIITGKLDVCGRGRVQGPRQIARQDCAVRGLVTQLHAYFGTLAIDEFCSVLSTNQRHVVTRHQQLCRQQ